MSGREGGPEGNSDIERRGEGERKIGKERE